MPQRVSLTMIVKNEAHRLGKCLGSVADLVDEIIIVDTGSTDGTQQLAAKFGATVIDFPWRDDFAAARNESLRHATGDWIFWLDADHWLDEENRQRLKKLFASLTDENVGYLMKWRSPSDETGSQATLLDATQLFRNLPQIRWEHRIHEQIRPAIQRSGGTTRWTDVAIYHTGYQNQAEKYRKLERNLRLLKLQDAEQPNDASTLFHLGWTYYLMGQPAEAWQPLEQALSLARPGETFVRKIYALLVRILRQLGRQQEAVTVAITGRQHFPNDPELLFHEGQLRREGGDLVGAERCLVQLLTAQPEQYITASVDPGLQTYKGRAALGEVFRDQGRLADAERAWRGALAEQPDFTVAWLLLGDMWLVNGRWAELENLVAELEANAKTRLDGLLLRARGLMMRKEFPAARKLLEETIAANPQAPWPRELLGHAMLMEGADTARLVQVLCDLLAIDPTNNFALQQLPLAEQRLAGGSASAPSTAGS